MQAVLLPADLIRALDYATAVVVIGVDPDTCQATTYIHALTGRCTCGTCVDTVPASTVCDLLLDAAAEIERATCPPQTSNAVTPYPAPVDSGTAGDRGPAPKP